MNAVALQWTTTEAKRAPLSLPLETDDVSLAVSGDARAFRRLYEAHVGRVHALACRMAGCDRARELTQDVFVRAWQKLGTFRGEARFGTWLHRLAINLILTHRQRWKTERDRTELSEGALEAVAARGGTRELGLDFESAIGRLPQGARDVFVLHDVEGYRHDEIARFLGVTTGTTKAQLHRARMLLRAHLNR